jgi:OOP family OmpA-OmpF porin
MMNKLRGMILGGLMVLLAGCTNFTASSEVDALNQAQATGSPFTQYLAAEYRDFANREMKKEFDYPDALHFARKGLAAASGEVVMPEPVSDWSLTPPKEEELANARGRLVVAFDMGARDAAPQQAAIAQVRFDCWIEQEEEAWQKKDIHECKSQFMDAMNQLEGLVKKPVVPPPVEAVAPPENAEPMKPQDAMYLVFFDFDKYSVTSGAQNVLDSVVTEVKSRSLKVVHVVGHTDTAGPKTYNYKLSMRRANAVREYLSSHGVDASVISVEGKGESQLLVKTPDNVREPANRRAQITFE